MTMRVLGLDMSSTTIGHCLLDGDRAEWGHLDLVGDIGAKCAQAALHVARLLERLEPTLVVIESPVARYAKAVIPQARVSGAVLAVLADESALWHEVPPSVAKTFLAGSGAADKRQMVEAAARRLGIAGRVLATRGKVCMVDSAGTLLTEDEADAYGLALAGLAVKVQIKEAA